MSGVSECVCVCVCVCVLCHYPVIVFASTCNNDLASFPDLFPLSVHGTEYGYEATLYFGILCHTLGHCLTIVLTLFPNCPGNETQLIILSYWVYMCYVFYRTSKD